ncbi:MAG TPA: hypothetical protein VLB82_01965, partial [Thermodesulfobacteriota bacterium]|nr:hypothetical protein [Thermodesulfobacteriota bacterium]
MATKVKVTQKELKKPDKFLEFIDRSTNYLAESYKLIVYFVGAIIALILIFFLINSYQNKNTSKANIIYKEGITAKTSGDFDTALTKFGILQKDYSGQKVSDLSLY